MSDEPENRDPANRQPDGRFGPGNRANPGGVPKEVLAVRRALLTHGDKAVAELVALMGSETERVRLGAVELVLAYVLGRPPQAINLGGDAIAPAVAALVALAERKGEK